jgi:hypothetical protein
MFRKSNYLLIFLISLCAEISSAQSGFLYTNPTGNQNINPPIVGGVQTRLNPAFLDLSAGTSTAPISTLSFSNPLFGATIYDASSGNTNTGCGGSTGAGLNYPVSAYQICIYESSLSGNPAVVPLYTSIVGTAGFKGFLGGTSANLTTNQGSMPIQIFHNTTLNDNSGWTVTGCTRLSGVVSITLNTSSAPNVLAIGDGVYVSGNSACSSGQNGVLIVTGVSGNTFTANQGGPNVTTPVSGGIAAPGHQVWTMEHNLFNNSFDPGPIRQFIGQNVQPVWGTTTTQQGLFPGSAAFFGDGQWYTGFFTPDNVDAGFVAGNPQSSTHPLNMQVAFRASPTQLATSTANYCSLPFQFQDAIFNGSISSPENYQINVCPSQATGHNVLQFQDNTGNIYVSIHANQVLSGSGSSTSPSFSTPGNPETGFYVDSGGVAQVTVNGSNKLSVSSSGVSAANGFTGKCPAGTTPNFSGGIATGCS